MKNILTVEKKDIIRAMAIQYVESCGGLNKAANSLNHISSGTLSNINRGVYTNISDDMWRNLRAQIGITPDNDQNTAIVETPAVKDLLFCMNENRANKDFVWAISPAGSGKTVAARLMKKQKNVFYILCDEDMNKSDFAAEFARAVGLRVNLQKKSRTAIMEVVRFLREQEDVLIIFDEGDKLSDNVLHYFITIYNYLEELAGIQFISTDYMVKRMANGLRYNKKGYQELWSRMGSKFYEIEKNTAYDVSAICRARGVNNQKDIDIVIKEVENANLDLRRANRKIKAIKRKKAHTTNI